MSSPSVYNEYNEHTLDEYEEFLEWKEERLKKQGIDVGASILGNMVHEKTLQSYKKLELQPENTPYLAALPRRLLKTRAGKK